MYVDYGNEEKVLVDHLRVADDPSILKLRAQAIPCCLSGFEQRDSDEALASRYFPNVISYITVSLYLSGSAKS